MEAKRELPEKIRYPAVAMSSNKENIWIFGGCYGDGDGDDDDEFSNKCYRYSIEKDQYYQIANLFIEDGWYYGISIQFKKDGNKDEIGLIGGYPEQISMIYDVKGNAFKQWDNTPYEEIIGAHQHCIDNNNDLVHIITLNAEHYTISLTTRKWKHLGNIKVVESIGYGGLVFDKHTSLVNVYI